MALHVFLEVRGGPMTFQRAVLAPGQRVRVGRTSLSDFAIPDDEQISQVHFEISWDGARCEVKDLGGAGGTLVGGERRESAFVRSGAWIRAGGTDFSVFFEEPVAETPGSAAAEEALSFLRDVAGRKTLFAVLDAARGRQIVSILRSSVDEYTSLYEGLRAETMEDCAPYIVRVAGDSRLLTRLVRGGWGDSWGVYIESSATLRELRAHFRRILVVTREKDSLPMYFRFYDPRVLRGFLPIATQRQIEVLFGPVHRFFTEATGGGGVRAFGRSSPGVLEERAAT